MSSDTVSRRPNWRYFSAVYAACVLLGVIVSVALEMLTRFEMPSAFSIALFFVAASIAGKRYAEGLAWDWTRDERLRLALVYAVASVFVSCLFAIPVFGLSIVFAPAEAPSPYADPLLLGFTLLAMPFVGLLNYAMARFAFGSVMKQAAKARGE